MRPFVLPRDPLRRFVEIYEALNERRGWLQDAMPLRFSALTLATCDGPPAAVAEAVYRVSAALRARAGWFGPLNSPVRFVLAAILVRNGDDPEAFCDEVERASGLFREAGLRRGSIYEVVAILLLRGPEVDQNLDAGAVLRFKSVYEDMKRHHWWLTGPEDYPACALVAARPEPVESAGLRIERFYGSLRDEGFSAGDPLQMVSHILALNPAKEAAVVRRFVDLRAGFKDAGVSMWQSDWDELALLTFVDAPVAEIVARVLAHREVMAELRPRPDRSLTFSLACGTAFLDLVRSGTAAQDVSDAKTLSQVQAILAARQAASAAAAASAASGAAASTS